MTDNTRAGRIRQAQQQGWDGDAYADAIQRYQTEWLAKPYPPRPQDPMLETAWLAAVLSIPDGTRPRMIRGGLQAAEVPA